MKKISFFLFCILLTLFSCKKKDNINPNKFITCKVNGKDWVAKESVQFSEEISAILQQQGRHFELSGFENNTQINISLYDVVMLKSGVYNLSAASKFAEYTDYDKSYYGYRSDSNNTSAMGVVDVLFDKVNKKVSRSFSFTAKNVVTNETVNITDGSFVVPYQEY